MISASRLAKHCTNYNFQTTPCTIRSARKKYTRTPRQKSNNSSKIKKHVRDLHFYFSTKNEKSEKIIFPELFSMGQKRVDQVGPGWTRLKAQTWSTKKINNFIFFTTTGPGWTGFSRLKSIFRKREEKRGENELNHELNELNGWIASPSEGYNREKPGQPGPFLVLRSYFNALHEKLNLVQPGPTRSNPVQGFWR